MMSFLQIECSEASLYFTFFKNFFTDGIFFILVPRIYTQEFPPNLGQLSIKRVFNM